jgi:hypothetical protein
VTSFDKELEKSLVKLTALWYWKIFNKLNFGYEKNAGYVFYITTAT